MPDPRPVAGWAHDGYHASEIHVDLNSDGTGSDEVPVVICPRELWDSIRDAMCAYAGRSDMLKDHAYRMALEQPQEASDE